MALTLTVNEFKIKFPEFSNIDGVCDSVIEDIIDESLLEVDEIYWGNRALLAVQYLAAHFLVLRLKQLAGNAGSNHEVASHSVDGVSESFSLPSTLGGTSVDFQLTSYGQRYAMYLQRLKPRIYVV